MLVDAANLVEYCNHPEEVLITASFGKHMDMKYLMVCMYGVWEMKWMVHGISDRNEQKNMVGMRLRQRKLCGVLIQKSRVSSSRKFRYTVGYVSGMGPGGIRAGL